MKDFLKRLTDLLKVKTIITLVVCGLFSYCVVKGEIEQQQLMNIVIMVVSFYFGCQHEKSVTK